MNAPLKLAGFAALLLLVFGVAVAAGGTIGPNRDGREPAAGHGAGEAMGDHEGAAPATVRGLAVSDGGLKLDVQETAIERGRPTELRFRIVGSDGQPLHDFDVEHEKRMHLIVVRRDGQGFQHLHPELDAAGVWHLELTLPDAGAYRLFADFVHDGEARTLATDLAVDGATDYRPLPQPTKTATSGDGYRVRLAAGSLHAGSEAKLSFSVTRDGRPVDTEPYLGAGGHLVALREGDLAYLHVHPEQEVEFMTEFPTPGRYRLYLQFKHAGRVHTAAFTQQVVR